MFTFFLCLLKIVGTMSILDKLADDFALPSSVDAEYLPFDAVSNTFDLKAARLHFELAVSKQNHSDHAEDVQKCQQSTEMDLEECLEEDPHLENVSEESENSDCAVVSSLTSVTLENERRRFDNKDKSFGTYLIQFLMNYPIYMSQTVKNDIWNLLTVRATVAVEQGNECLTKCLLDMGLDVNCRRVWSYSAQHCCTLSEHFVV